MKKKLLITLLIILLVIAILLILNIKNKTKTTKNLNVDETSQINICKTENCPVAKNIIYTKITINTKNKDMQNIIDKINKETQKRYNKTINSNVNSKNCQSVKDIYKYSYISYQDLNLFENDKYISIAFTRYNRNLCTNNGYREKPEVYIYSKEKDKILTQKEFKNEQNINKEKQKEAIITAIENYNRTYNTKNTYDDINKKSIKYFYNPNGKLALYYYQTKTKDYNIANIEKTDK